MSQPVCALNRLTEDIIHLTSPQLVVLFSQKQSSDGSLASVKLCVVVKQGDADGVERQIYLTVDSELPFDVLVYTQEDWDRLCADASSFAHRIRRTGRVLYEAKPSLQ